MKLEGQGKTRSDGSIDMRSLLAGAAVAAALMGGGAALAAPCTTAGALAALPAWFRAGPLRSWDDVVCAYAAAWLAGCRG